MEFIKSTLLITSLICLDCAVARATSIGQAAHTVKDAVSQTARVVADKVKEGLHETRKRASDSLSRAKIAHYKSKSNEKAFDAIDSAQTSVEYENKLRKEKTKERLHKIKSLAHSIPVKANIAIEDVQAQHKRHQAKKQVEEVLSSAAHAVEEEIHDAANFVTTTIAHAQEDHARRKQIEQAKRRKVAKLERTVYRVDTKKAEPVTVKKTARIVAFETTVA